MSDTIKEETEKFLYEIIGTKEWGKETIEVAYYEIKRLCGELDIDDGRVPVAKAIYNRSLNNGVIEYTKIYELSAVAVYTACRTENTPISPSEIASVSDISESKLTNIFTDVIGPLQLEVGPVDPKQYVSRYCNELNRSKAVEAKAIEILDYCDNLDLFSGKSPSAYAASAVYMSSLLVNEKATQKEVAEISQSSVETIRSRYKEQLYAVAEQGDVDLDLDEDHDYF